MTRILTALLIPLLLSGCAASAQDQEAKVSHKAERTVASEPEHPVSHDSSRNAFVEVNEEKIGVDSDAVKPEDVTEIVFVTESEDWRGRTVSISEEKRTVPTEWLTGE